MVRRLLAPSLALALVAAWLVLLGSPAHAACHIAGFVESEVEAEESTGEVSLVVELQGGVGSCAGTVDVATADGTAVAGEDYEAVSQTLVFEENDDRVETVDITILADDEADGGEDFTVELSNPTGDITGTSGPATVTIVEDGDQAGQDADVEEDDATTDAADPTDADDDAGDAVTGDDEAGTDDAGDDDAGTDDEGSGTIGIILAVVAAIAIGVGAFVVLRGRGE